MKTKIKKAASVIITLCALFSHGATLPDTGLLTAKTANSGNIAVHPAPRHARWLEDHAKREARLQKGDVDILLIGDSITHGWKRYPEILKRFFGDQQVINLGHPADKTENIIWRLANHHMEKINPRVAIVLAGTNNSNNDEYTEEEIAGGVEAIVQILQAKLPQTKILLLGIFPRGSREQRIGIKGGLTEADMNPQWAKIDRVNQIIQTFTDGENVVYLNINQAFLNENGSLPVAVMPDLLHPNEKGYEIWGSTIIPTLENMMKSSTK